jgi:hypothetical protein
MRTLQIAIEAQRDMGSPTGEDGTWFVPCADEDAEQYAVTNTSGELVADFATRAEAQAFADELATLRPGDTFETRDGFYVVACIAPFTFDGPMTEGEAQENGDAFEDAPPPSFVSLRLGGCKADADGVDGLQSAADAEFFTVYGVDAEGIALAIVDADTLAEGEASMARLAASLEVPSERCRFL